MKLNKNIVKNKKITIYEQSSILIKSKLSKFTKFMTEIQGNLINKINKLYASDKKKGKESLPLSQTEYFRQKIKKLQQKKNFAAGDSGATIVDSQNVRNGKSVL